MTFRLPDFPLLCDVYTNPTGDFFTKVLRLSGIKCQLRGPQQGPRPGNAFFGDFMDVSYVQLLLIPPLTDIRGRAQVGANLVDILEVPSGSNRWYVPQVVDDIAKGFPNEHRFCTLSMLFPNPQIVNCPPWPVPLP